MRRSHACRSSRRGIAVIPVLGVGDISQDDADWLRDVLAGRPPRPPQPQAGYTNKQPRSATTERAERVRIGAADRMENLLPKH